MNPQPYQDSTGQTFLCGFYNDVPWPDGSGQRASANQLQDRLSAIGMAQGMANIQAGDDYWTNLMRHLAQRPEPKLVRAQRIAAEVRANNPAMQVKRRTPV